MSCMLLLSGVSFLFFTVPSASGSQAPGTRAVDQELAAVTEEVYTVGTFSGQDWETFGRIADVDFDADGNLYILDEGNYRVVVLDRDGALVRVIGSQGEGPGEFSAPTRAAILEDGRLVVYDMGFRHSRFSIRRGALSAAPRSVRCRGGCPGSRCFRSGRAAWSLPEG